MHAAFEAFPTLARRRVGDGDLSDSLVERGGVCLCILAACKDGPMVRDLILAS